MNTNYKEHNMALFGGKQAQEQGTTEEQSSMGDQSYLDDMAGQGTEGFTQETISTAYLSMVQPGSTAALTHEPGTWRNSATDENYGPSVEIIPVAFKTVWTERDREPPYMTIGRYDPKSIEVDITYPKPGQRGFPKMVNPQSGNVVQELFIYAVLLAQQPEAGILYFSPTVGSMKACKAWNSLLRSQRLPSGKLAPIFAFSWSLDLDLVTNPNKPADKIAKFVKARMEHIVAKDLFFTQVQPQLAAGRDIALLAAPEKSGDTEE
jgi:hypothetical protein